MITCREQAWRLKAYATAIRDTIRLGVDGKKTLTMEMIEALISERQRVLGRVYAWQDRTGNNLARWKEARKKAKDSREKKPPSLPGKYVAPKNYTREERQRRQRLMSSPAQGSTTHIHNGTWGMAHMTGTRD